MQAIHKKAIWAGICGSIVIVVLIILYNIVDLLYISQAVDKYGYNYALYDSSPFYLLLTLGIYFLYLVYALVFVAVGVLAIRMAAPELKRSEDVTLVAAISGMVTGILCSLANVVISVIATYISTSLMGPLMSDLLIDSNVRNSMPLIGAVVAGVVDLVCCMPLILILGTVLALIGGLAYWVLFLNKTATA